MNFFVLNGKMAYNPGFGGRLDLVPGFQPAHDMGWRDNRTAHYRAEKSKPGLSMFNKVPFDRNWGRSMWMPTATAMYPLEPMQAVTMADTPAVPLATQMPSDYVHSTWFDPPHVTAYDSTCSSLPQRRLVLE